MGRLPKPNELKVIEGGRNRASRRAVPVEDTPVVANPLGNPPAIFTDREREVWENVGRELPPGMLRTVDEYVLTAFCRAVALADVASIALRTAGLVIQTPNGALQQSPYVGIINTQSKNIKAMAAELGLSPAARTRIEAGGDDHEEDPTDKYFRKRSD